MDVKKILSEIDAEIARLQLARAAILGIGNGDAPALPRRGRPKGSVNAVKTPKPAKRHLSPEGRKRIADAVKRRWAARRKEAAPKETAKKDTSKRDAAKKAVAA